MRRALVFGTVLVLVLGGLTASAWAQPSNDNFWIKLDPRLTEPTGGGTGWEDPASGQQWFYYPDTNWWNQWFYDGRPDPERWKYIDYVVQIESSPIDPNQTDPTAEWVMVALNWSNMQFPETGPNGPPPMPCDEGAIERAIIFEGFVLTWDQVTLQDRFVIPDYNPEWVSIDVMTDFMFSENVIEISGGLVHECVPEPSTVALVLMGALGLAAYAWRKRR